MAKPRVVIIGNDPIWRAYETRAYPSRLYHPIGTPPGTRTPTNGFGDHRATVTLIQQGARYRTRTCKTLFLRQVCMPIPSIGLAEKLGLEPR